MSCIHKNYEAAKMKDKITTVDDFMERTPEEYKQTPIGDIPVDWEVVKIGIKM